MPEGGMHKCGAMCVNLTCFLLNTLSATVQVLEEKETRMTFVISRVERHDFHSYRFHAVNDVGSGSHAVTLTRSYSPPTSSTGLAPVSAQ